MAGEKSSLRIILHSLINFVVLIISLIILNVLLSHIHNATYVNLVGFLNSLLGLFFTLFLIGMINSLFWNFEFPLNLLAPLSGGALGVFIVQLLSKILEFTQTFFYFDFLAKILSYNVYAFVFFATLIIGYLIIFSEQNWNGESSKEEVIKKDIKQKKKTPEQNLTWKDVEHEFRKLLHNIAKALNSMFSKKRGFRKSYDGKEEKKKHKKN